MSIDPRPLLVVQHEPECPPALIGRWLEDAGVTLDVRRPDLADDLPATLADHIGVLVLGGAMGADDEATHPWLTEVKELVRAAAHDDVPVLGICLGHQLIGAALGGTVQQNPRGRQLGLIQTGWTPQAREDVLFAALAQKPARALHWNDDIVTALPDGAVPLARTVDGEVQVVRFAPRIWGIQPHPEADDAIAAGWSAKDDPSTPRPAARAAVEAVRGARAELDATWAPVADAFARQLQVPRRSDPAVGP